MTHAVPIPTTRDADPGESLEVFIASCRLSCILDSLLPVLGSDSIKEVDHRTAIHEAAKQMEDLDRVTNLKDHEPGACKLTDTEKYGSVRSESFADSSLGSYRLDYLGVQVLICRIGLDEAGPLSARQLEKVAGHVLGIAEGVADFLDNLMVEDYSAFWAPCTSSPSSQVHSHVNLLTRSQGSSYHISHAASLILQTCLKLSQIKSDLASLSIFDALFSLLKRIVTACQVQAGGYNEVAEAAVPRLRRLILSVPELELHHDTLSEIKTMLAPVPASDLAQSHSGEYCTCLYSAQIRYLDETDQ